MRLGTLSKGARALKLLLGIAVLLPALAAAPAAAQQERVTTPSTALTTTDQLVVVIRQLIAAGRYDEARALIRSFRSGDATWRYRVAYVEGLIQRHRGNYAAAIATFRSILAEQPRFTFVRIDLTETLYLAGQDDQARHNAELLIAAGVDDRIGGGMRSLIGAIDDRRPLRFRAFASLLPSTNINGGTDQRSIVIGGLPFLIDSGSLRQSGIGVMLGGEVNFRQSFRKDLAVVGSLGGTGRFYPSIGRLDLFIDAQTGIEKRGAKGQMSLSVVARQDHANLRAAFREAGVQIEGSRFVGKAGRVYGRLRATARDFMNETARDGYRIELSGFYDRFFGTQRFVRLLGGFITEQANVAMVSYNEVQVGVGHNVELPLGISLYTQALYANRRYKAPLLFFGTRQDHRIEALATVTKRDFTLMGLAPQITYSFVRNFSNYVFEDTTSHSLDFRLVRNF